MSADLVFWAAAIPACLWLAFRCRRFDRLMGGSAPNA